MPPMMLLQAAGKKLARSGRFHTGRPSALIAPVIRLRDSAAGHRREESPQGCVTSGSLQPEPATCAG